MDSAPATRTVYAKEKVWLNKIRKEGHEKVVARFTARNGRR